MLKMNVSLPLDFELVAIRPILMGMPFSIVLAFSESKNEYATWKYGHDFADCDSGYYFKDSEKALKSFLTRNRPAPTGGGLFVLNQDDIETINAALNEEVKNRTEEMKYNSDVQESNQNAIEGIIETYQKLNGKEMEQVEV